MFLRNCWYVAAWSRDIGHEPFARTILGEEILFFRQGSGPIVAMEDRCPHRHVPLSMGWVVGDTIQCRYHGLIFDGAGQCFEVPNQKARPRNACVRSYPVADLYGWVWIWMGDPAMADEALIPDYHRLTDPALAVVGDYYRLDCDYRLFTDNLLDLSHVDFVHAGTIASDDRDGRVDFKVTERDDGVDVKRFVYDIPAPPMYLKSGRLPLTGNVDRWQLIDFTAPGFVRIHVGAAAADTGVAEQQFAHGLNLWVMLATTPETATSSHHFWASAREHMIDDDGLDALFKQETGKASAEDKVILEAQQRIIDRRGDSRDVSFRADTASIAARRVLAKLIAAAPDIGG